MKEFLIAVRSRPELLILSIMVLIIAMLIIPLPTFLVDFLIGLNIAISLLIFMSSFYILKVLNFKTFPSILLMTTLFRLALSISTSRLILLDANAGEIIRTFGEFVIQDNLIVGIVIFSIVTVVQFIVITKGSERIAEVAARFSLDAMPGKQMGIDADLRSGIIDNDEVKNRRDSLEQESQLFGSFDGAMKFIKGDAIAGILIIFVNLIGGISVGVTQHGMDISTALNSFTILTIGDGLVAQIPALLISISAGLIVTRVSGSEKNLGQNIISELFSNDFSIIVTGLLTFAIGFLPGFPSTIFMVLSAMILAIYIVKTFDKFRRYFRDRNNRNNVPGIENTNIHLNEDAIENNKPSQNEDFDIDGYVPETLPIIISISRKHSDYFGQIQLDKIIRKHIFVKYGYRAPDISINFSGIAENTISIYINEIHAASYRVFIGGIKILGNQNEVALLGLNVTYLDEINGKKSCWVIKNNALNIIKMGVLTKSDIDEIKDVCSMLLLRNINEFFGIQEAKNLLDDLEKKYPELLKECYRHVTVQKITEVFQRLLIEKISIRNMKLILESLVQWAPKEKEPMMLVEHVRASLSRYISDKFSVNGSINAFMVSSEIENSIRQGIRQSSAGAFLSLEPEITEKIMQKFDLAFENMLTPLRDFIIFTPVDIRRFLKRIIENKYPDLEVLSFNEVSELVRININKTI